jgi:hypothetical protein
MAELSDAIVAIINGGDVQYTFNGSEITTWVSDTVTQPTAEELQAKLDELNA